MFKGLKAGRRNAGRGGASSGRISGLHTHRGRDISTDQRRRPAFMPDTPQEQGRDSNSSRLSGLEE